jgi:hypothetical protein
MKTFTFTFRCTFEMQFTWPQTSVCVEAGEDEPEPTSAALMALEKELLNQFEDYAVSKLKIRTDSIVLLGIEDDGRSNGAS